MAFGHSNFSVGTVNSVRTVDGLDLLGACLKSLVGRASRLPPGRLAPAHSRAGRPRIAGQRPAPLFCKHALVPWLRAKSFLEPDFPGLPDPFAFAIGQRVAKIFACFFGERFQALYDFRVFLSDVGRFTDVVLQIVKLGRLQLAGFVLGGDAVSSPGTSAERAVGMRQLQFPAAVRAYDRWKLQ